MLVVAVGTAGAWKPPVAKAVKGYNGCFDNDGALIGDLESHVAAGKPAFSQVTTKLENPLRYCKTEYGRRPKHLFHYTTKKNAKDIAADRYIAKTEVSSGDAFLGEGVYMTSIPSWANPDVVKKNNYGERISKTFNKWHTANAYVRVDYDKLVDILDMTPKADWQSNFCIRVPKGKLFLTEGIGAVICWDRIWGRNDEEWIGSEQWDWKPPARVPRPRGRAPLGAEWNYESGAWEGGAKPTKRGIDGGDGRTCQCGVAAARRTARTGQNEGRAFYCCGERDGGVCSFFRWDSTG